ncbi:MAG: MBL fold metallo-hydrolase [Bacillota bacterium]
MRNGVKAVIFILCFVIAAASYMLTAKEMKPVYEVSAMELTDGMINVCEGVYVITNKEHKVNMTLVVSGGEGVLIDAGDNEEDGKVLESFLKKNNVQISNIFITHSHSDHVFNLEKFSASASNVYKYDNTEDGQQVKVGDMSFRVLHTPGHDYNKHMSIEIEDKNILLAGDIVYSDNIPSMGYGSTYEDHVSTWERLAKNRYDLIIPGHGELVNGTLALERHLEYVKNATYKVREILKSGGSRQEINEIKLEDCMKDSSFITASNAANLHKTNMLLIYAKVKKELGIK